MEKGWGLHAVRWKEGWLDGCCGNYLDSIYGMCLSISNFELSWKSFCRIVCMTLSVPRCRFALGENENILKTPTKQRRSFHRLEVQQAREAFQEIKDQICTIQSGCDANKFIYDYRKHELEFPWHSWAVATNNQRHFHMPNIKFSLPPDARWLFVEYQSHLQKAGEFKQ